MKHITFNLPINTRKLADSLLELVVDIVIVRATVQRNPFSLEEVIEFELADNISEQDNTPFITKKSDRPTGER